MKIPMTLTYTLPILVRDVAMLKSKLEFLLCFSSDLIISIDDVRKVSVEVEILQRSNLFLEILDL